MRQIAKVLKSNGSEGEVLVSFTSMDPEEIDLQEPVFIEFEGLPVPFFIESFTRRGNSRALVRLTGIKSLKDAEEIAGRAILLDIDDDEFEEGYDGWTLLVADGSPVGTIVGYEPIPGNLLLRVQTPRSETLVPLQEELILEEDEVSRTLTMSIPEGLLDL